MVLILGLFSELLPASLIRNRTFRYIIATAVAKGDV